MPELSKIQKANKLNTCHSVDFCGYDNDGDYLSIKFDKEDAQKILDFIKLELNKKLLK